LAVVGTHSHLGRLLIQAIEGNSIAIYPEQEGEEGEDEEEETSLSKALCPVDKVWRMACQDLTGERSGSARRRSCKTGGGPA